MPIDWNKINSSSGGDVPVTTSTKNTKLNFGQALGVASKRMGQSISGGLLEIPKGIVRAGLTPLGFLQEASGKKVKPIQLPKFLESITGQKQTLDYAPPKTLGEVGMRILDTSMTPGFGVKTAVKAILPKTTTKIAENIPKWFPRQSQEYKQVKTLVKERNRLAEVSGVQFKREAKTILQPLKKTNELGDFVNIVTGRATALKPSEKLTKAVDWYSKITKSQEKSLLDRGISQSILDERKYLELRTLTGKTTDELKKELGVNASGAEKISQALVNRKPFEPLYVPIAQEDIPQWSQLYFSKFLNKAGKPSFVKKATGAGVAKDTRTMDAFKLITQRQIKAQKETLQNQLVKDIENKFAKPFKGTIPSNETMWRPEGNIRFFPSENGVGVTKSGVKQYTVSKNVMDAFNTWKDGLVVQNKWFNNSMKALDGVTNLWKITTLPLRPGWSAINTVGNVMLNLVGGVKPTSYIKALMPKYTKLFAKEKLENLGVKSAIGISEIRSGPLKNVAQSLYKPNQYIENFFRWTHFIDKASSVAKKEMKVTGQKGKDTLLNLIKNSDSIHKKAVGEVNKYLFDYSGLSAAEQQLIRRAVPFYTWLKNITRLSAEQSINETWKAGQVVTFIKKIQSGTKDDKDIPEYLRGGIKTGLALDSDGNIIKEESGGSPLYWNWRYMFPFTDVGNIGLSALHPILKIPIERATGKQLMPQESKEFTAPYLGKFEQAPKKPNILQSLIKPDIKYTGKEPTKAIPSIGRHITSQMSLARFIETMAKPYAKYSATGEPIKNKYGKISYPKSKQLEVLRYLTGVGLTPYSKKK